MKDNVRTTSECIRTLMLAVAMVLAAVIMPFMPGSMMVQAETTTSTITVDGTDYTLFTGFTATDGTAGTFGYANFVDGNTSTEWWVGKKDGEIAGDFAGGTEDPAYVEFHADAPIIPKGYVLTYDNSVNENWKPTSWALKAKLSESDEWTTIHSSNSSLGNGSRFEIACNNDGDNMYQYFRFEIYDVGSTYQSILNELEFYGNKGFIHLTPKVATCTETGIKQECWYSYGKYFSDANGTTELDESAIVEPMKAHTCVHHEASATNTEYWQCSVCGKYFSDSGCTNEISEAEALIGVFGTLADGRYTLMSQTYTLTGDENTAGYIYVPEGVTATIDLNGHTIDRGLTSKVDKGSVIIVDGTLTIKDSGTGGKVQGGYAADEGSCVRVQAGATFTLQSGTLIGRDEEFDYTVGVYRSTFNMSGGKITNGWGGVFMYGTATMSGGEISGNSCYGVKLIKNDFSVSGNPVITNNTENNIWFWDDSYVLKVVGELAEGANIGIRPPIPTDNAPVTVTSGYGTYNSAAPDTYFTLDNNDYMTVVLGWNEDKTELAVGTAMRTVAFDMNGHGDAIEAISLLSGYKLMKPEPTADGWYFVGWYTDAACTAGNEYDFDDAVTSNMTLHALWTQTAIHSITLPENMVIVSTDKEAVGGKYPVGTVIKFKVSSADYVVESDVSDGTNTLTADGDGIYTVTVGNADITITATVKKVVEANKELSGSESYTAQDGDVLTGSTSGTVTIAEDAKITLSDVTITSGIVCAGTAEITLVGTNSVTAGYGKAGIQVGGSGTTLTIKGNGSLTANGGNDSAGIGLSRAWDVDATGGDIVIEGGNITATGNDMGAGIGTGVSYGNGTDNTATLGNITIKGGTVRAIGGTNNGNGIGKGYAYVSGHAVVGTITIYDGINLVDASSISESVVYMNGETDVTANKADYFTIYEDGSRELIVPKPVIADIPNQTYTGSAITPKPQVTIGSLSLTKGTDYEYSYSDNTNVGTAKVTITFKGEYAWLGSVEKEFNIVNLTSENVSDIADQTYTGSAIKPEVTVNDGETRLALGTDYTVSYSDNTNAGTAKVIITGIGNYSGTVEKTFTINKATPTVTSPTAKTLTYTGSAQELVTAGSTNFGKVLYSLDGKTYSESIPKAANAGEYKVYYKVDGTDNWNAVEAQSVTVSIEPKEVSLDWEKVSFTYDGTVKTPSVTAGGLISGDSCDVTVTGGQIKAGSYTATAESLSNSNYSLPADKTTTFEINKAATTPNTPEQTMEVDYSVKKVGDIKLSGDWAIRDTDKDKDLVVGTPLKVTALYIGDDKGNYVTESVAIEVTRAECKHTGMVATEAKAQTCVDAGNSAYWYCPECGRYYSDSKGETEIAKDSWILKALGHEYGEPIYTWSEDGKSCTAKVICTRKECTDDTEGHTVTETVQSTGKETKAATCEEKGITTYTATFENELFKTQTKEVADIPEKGHISSEAVKENVVAETCEEEGTYDEVVYCSKCNKELSREEKTIPAKGHIYGITTYTWSEDGKTCTATSVCSNDSTHKITETAIYEPDKADSQIKATVKEAATTEKMGTTTYTATFKNTEMFKVQTKDVVDIPKVEVTDNPSDNPSDTPSDNPTDKPGDNPSKPTDTTKPSDATKTDGNTSSNDNTKDTSVTPAPKEEGAKLPVSDTKAEYVVNSKAGEEPAVEYKPASDAADKTVSIPESVTVDGVTYAVNEIADNAFKGNKTVESVVIPKSVKEIGDSAFSGCTKLKSVTIPGSVTEIGDNAFTGCTNLKSVKIPESVTEIGDKAFSGCKKLKSVTIGKNVAEIGDSAFVNCIALKKATLPANVTKLGSNIFKGCKNLKTIMVKTTKLTSKNIAKNALKGVGKKVTIKVPKKVKKAYTKLFRKKGLSKKVKIK